MNSNDILIENKIDELKILNKKISEMEKELRQLKLKKKGISSFISNNCEHVWIKEMDYTQYSKSYNLCIKCKTLKGIS